MDNKKLLIADSLIISFSGLAGISALISLIARDSWGSVGELHLKQRRIIVSTSFSSNRANSYYTTECGNSCILCIIGIIITWIAFLMGILRLRYKSVAASRRCKTLHFISLIAGFLSLLSSVAVWADMMCHLPYELDHSNQIRQGLAANPHCHDSNCQDLRSRISKPKTHISTNSYHKHGCSFGWAYWVCVTAVLSLFFGNFIYLIRRDFEPKSSVIANLSTYSYY